MLFALETQIKDRGLFIIVLSRQILVGIALKILNSTRLSFNLFCAVSAGFSSLTGLHENSAFAFLPRAP